MAHEPAPGRWPLYEKSLRVGSAATTASAAVWSAAVVPPIDVPPLETPWLNGQPDVGSLSVAGASSSGCVASVCSFEPTPPMAAHHWSCVASVGVLCVQRDLVAQVDEALGVRRVGLEPRLPAGEDAA